MLDNVSNRSRSPQATPPTAARHNVPPLPLSVQEHLGQMMRASGSDVLSGATAVVPVPLHLTRRWSRGFNQADDLARVLGLPVCHALRRVRRTATQASLGASDRYVNVEGAFAATRRARTLQARAVVLVDDVKTTGATLEACARALKRAGVREVRVLTAATAARPPPSPRWSAGVRSAY